MGHHYNTVTGYGLLVLNDDENEEEIFEYGPPEGVTVEMVGDFVLDEDVAVFYMVDNADITVALNSENQVSDYVVEYTDFTLNNISPEIEAWFKKIQEESDQPCRLGVFRVDYFG